MRAGRVRFVFGVGRRALRLLVPRAGGVYGAASRSSPSRACPAGHPDRPPARLRRHRCRPVRVLHPRPDRRRPRLARSQPGARPRSRFARSCPATCVGAPAMDGSSRPSRVGVARRVEATVEIERDRPHHRTRPRHVLGASPMRRTVSPDPGTFASRPISAVTACCGGPPCVRRIRMPGSCAIDVSPAWRIIGVEAVITRPTSPARPPTG